MLIPEVMCVRIEKYVDDMPPERVRYSKAIEDEPPVLAPRTLVATFPKLGQAKLQMEWPSVRMTDSDMYALDLLSTVLGGGESSVLVQELRDKRELVNAVEASDATAGLISLGRL